MHATDWGLLVLLSFVWGISFFFIKIALKGFSPLTIVFGRVVTAALALNVILRLRGESLPRKWTDWRHFLIIGIFNNVIPFTLIAWAGTQISSGLTSILNASAPLWAVLIAHFYNNEKITPLKILGMLLGFGGVSVMIGVESLAGIGMNTLAQIGMLAATLSYAAAGAYTQRVKHQYSPTLLATGQVTVSTVIMLVLAALIDQPWLKPMPSLVSWVSVIELGLVGTTIAYLIYFKVLRTAGASNALLTTFMIPVTALFFGITFLGESLQYYHFIGMALIAGGLLSIDGRVFQRFSKSPAIEAVVE
jgi:drug/metabolite transporter (DMT)-like permease